MYTGQDRGVTYEKTESEEVFSIVSYIRFKNLQFHWSMYP